MFCLDKSYIGRRQKRRLSFERMKELQVASQGQVYGNIDSHLNSSSQHALLNASSACIGLNDPQTFAPLASSIDEPTRSVMVRESSVESTYESQNALMTRSGGYNLSEAEDEEGSEDAENEEEDFNFRKHLKKRLYEALRRKSQEGLEAMDKGNLQTLKAVASLAAVAGGMGATHELDKTVANGNYLIDIFRKPIVNKLVSGLGFYFALFKALTILFNQSNVF